MDVLTLEVFDKLIRDSEVLRNSIPKIQTGDLARCSEWFSRHIPITVDDKFHGLGTSYRGITIHVNGNLPANMIMIEDGDETTLIYMDTNKAIKYSPPKYKTHIDPYAPF